ncbi:MAG: monovalent cation/H+ antiporter subunit D family protein [Propionibacteriaceae bacterium]|nr:monovalent cation/H+ antiporter subunit D family protein [Propionibacteriaceae bacterium]
MNPALLPLLVVVPLLLTAVTLLWRTVRAQRSMLMLSPALSLAAGVWLLATHVREPAIAHAVGSLLPGIGIVFVSDSLTALLMIVTAAITMVASAFLIATGEDRYRFVVPLVIMLGAGVNGILLTGDLFNLFVFVEVMLMPSYALIALTGTWRRLGIGRMFIIVNIVASTILVIGVGFVYGVTGTVNLAMLRGVGAENPQAALAIGVVLLALLVKGGVVPAHGWLVRGYPGTSAGIMGLFSALHTKMGLYAVYRIYATVFDGAAPYGWVLLTIVVLTVLVGAVGTFGERRMRGALAFQMVTGVGQILIGLVVFTQFSVAAGLFYMVHHMITMAGLIMAAGAIEETYGSGRFDRLSGLMKRERIIATLMALGFLSLVGLPPTSGLWGKIMLLGSAATGPTWRMWLLLGSVALASVVSLLALQRFWREVFWGPPIREFLPDDPLTHRGRRTRITDETRIPGRLITPSLIMIGGSVMLFPTVGLVWPFFQRAALALVSLDPYVEAVLGG